MYGFGAFVLLWGFDDILAIQHCIRYGHDYNDVCIALAQFQQLSTVYF